MESDKPSTPESVFRELRGCIEQAQYKHAGQYIIQSQRSDVLGLLLAVQELVSAQQALSDIVYKKIGPGTASTIDVGAVANIIGVLSRDVELTDVEMITEDLAVLSCCVANRVPLDTVEMIRLEGKWYIKADPPIPGMAGEIHKLAAAIHRVIDEFERRDMTTRELRRELDKRQAPILERIVELEQQHEAGKKDSTPQ